MRSSEQIENDIQNLLSKPAATATRKRPAIIMGLLALLLLGQFFVIVNMSGHNQSLIKKVNHYESGFNKWQEVGLDLYKPLPEPYDHTKPPEQDNALNI